MKKCPACEKTFEDSMRFCQTDGTPLVDDAPAFDPYATIVGKQMPVPPSQIEPATESEAAASVSKSASEPDEQIHATVGSIPISEPDDVLDLPSTDPLKTMYVSDSEMADALGKKEQAEDIIDLPPIAVGSPEPPSFLAPEPTPASPPPSPFAAPDPISDPVPETPAAPSWEAQTPFEPEQKPVEPQSSPFSEPAPDRYDEVATMIQPSYSSPFDQPETPAAPLEQWTPPPAPEASWQNQDIGQNTPFQPPAGAAGQNKTLAIISLVVGIISILCCSGFFIPGIAAVVLGFMARGKASSSPNEYGGSGLALGGIITGAISILFGVLYWALVFLQVVALPNM